MNIFFMILLILFLVWILYIFVNTFILVKENNKKLDELYTLVKSNSEKINEILTRME